MKNPRSSLIFAASHGAAFVLGWLVWKGGGGKIAHEAEGLMRSGKSGDENRVRRNRDEGATSGDRLLEEIVREIRPGTGKFEGWKKWAENNRVRWGRILAEADQIPVAAEPEAAALRAMQRQAGNWLDEKLHVEATVRLIHWLRIDPEAAIRSGGADLSEAAMAIAMEKGADHVLAWPDPDQKLGKDFRQLLVRQLAAEGNLDGIRRVRESGGEEEWSNLRRMSADAWPLEKPDELLAFCRGDGGLGVIANFAAGNGADGAWWIQNLLSSGRLDEAEKESIVRTAMYAEVMWRNPTLPIETRVEVLSQYRPGRSRETVMDEIAGRDVADFLRSGKDYRYPFRQGGISAEQVLAEASVGLPDLAARSPELLRNLVFKALAKENGVRAMSLLDGASAEEKSNALMDAATSFQQVNPQQLHDYMRAIPLDGARWEQRLETWTKMGKQNHERLGGNYVEWVKQLPEGLDKDMAAYALVKSLEKDPGGLSGAIVNGIRDEKVRALLAEKP